MAAHLAEPGRGFSRTVAGSLLLHVVVITLALVLFNAPKRRIFTPVYTVDIVAPGPTHRHTAKAAEAPPPAKKEVVHEKLVKKAVAVKEKTPPVKEKKAVVKTKAAPEKQEVSVAEKVAEIARKKKEERAEKLISSSIEEIKKKQKEQAREVSRELEDIKKRLESRQALSAAASQQAGKAAAAETAATREGPAKRTAETARIGFAGRSGVTSENLQTKYREYYNIIHDRVHEQWIYPEGFDYRNVSVVVSIRIDRKGNLINSWLEESSGNRSFDDSLVNATKKAAPFPPLPADYEGNFLDIGLRFCPSCPE